MTKTNQTDMAIPEARADAPASFIMKPPHSSSAMGKVGAFALGFVAGVTALAITAAIADDLVSETPRSKGDGHGISDPKALVAIGHNPTRR